MINKNTYLNIDFMSKTTVQAHHTDRPRENQGHSGYLPMQDFSRLHGLPNLSHFSATPPVSPQNHTGMEDGAPCPQQAP